MSAIGNPVPSPTQTPKPGASAPFAAAPRRSRLWWLLLLVVIVAGGGLAAWLLRPQAKAPAGAVAVVQTVKVVSGTLERTIRVAGQTSARNYANIIAPLLRGPENRNSLILLKMIKSGTPVKKGDLLAQIDAQSAEDHIEDTNDTVQQAQNDVKKRLAEQAVEWENLQQTVRVAKAEFDKAAKEAQAAEVRTVVDQELLKLSAEEYEARYKQALADLPFKKESHRAELRLLAITNIRQDRHLERHVVDIKKYTIQSPMNGMAVAQSIWRGGDMAQTQEGDQVYPGQPIAKVVDLSNMQVEAVVNQTESDEFRIGQPARITLDAFPGAELKGKVYSIGALAVGGRMQNYYIRNIPVRVMIEGADPRLIPDLSAAAQVVIGRSEPNSTLVPLNTLTQEGGKTYVDVKKAENFEKREVQLGMRNGTHAVVLAGLTAGDEVRVN
ncbi:MAG: HlyD family efflux transporter periplasmic adaptor subunit [Bryobacterales bacterium]|nr:HlyD family efflux transporter periplasmic adaptor subunit [Bryobacterales bacterium]